MAMNKGVQMSKNDLTIERAKLKTSTTTKKKTAGRMAKLKASSWYKGAARSIGIGNRNRREKRNELIND
jgi:hypothetical protein